MRCIQYKSDGEGRNNVRIRLCSATLKSAGINTCAGSRLGIGSGLRIGSYGLSNCDGVSYSSCSCFVVTTEPDDYEACKEALLAAKPDLEFIESKVTFVPMTYVELEGEAKEDFEKLLAKLEALDDVDVVYHNASNV